MKDAVGRIPRFKTLEAVVVICVFQLCHGYYQWRQDRVLIASFFWIFSLVQLYVIHRTTMEPDTCAYNFVNSNREKSGPTVVCLGDSITHGRISSDWVSEIQPSISRPLHVVNNGQNGITTYRTFHERVDWTLACKPDYVVVLVGTNDAICLQYPEMAAYLKMVWGLPDLITPISIEANLRAIIEKLLTDAKVKIALCTIPPLGEDLTSEWNQNAASTVNRIIEKVHEAFKSRVTLLDVYGALESKIRESNASTTGSDITRFAILGFWQTWARFVFQRNWNRLSRDVGNTVLTDGVHLNDIGGDAIKELVVDWLRAQEKC